MVQYNRFLDIRNHGFTRVAVVIPRVHLADPEANAEEHKRWLKEAHDAGVSYALCPELGLSGYTNDDLFHNLTLLQASEKALAYLVSASHGWPNMLFTVGLPLLVDGMVFNCAATILRGRVMSVSPKTYPPEYREFYELRHFARSTEARSKTVVVGGRTVLFGNDTLIRSRDNPNFVLHTDICEDIWVPIAPGTEAALAGATLLANLSASNITIGKAAYREQLVVGSSGKNVCVQMYSAAGFGESTSRASWDGDGYIAERGTLVARTPRFELEGTMIVSDVNLAMVNQDRMRQGSFRQNAADHRKAFRSVTFGEVWENAVRKSSLEVFRRDIDPYPFVPRDASALDDRCFETFNIQATALVRRLMVLPESMRKVFLAYSGGQDSTMALLVALRAMDLLKLPRTNIVCITMPGFGTSKDTYDIACALPKAFGTMFEEISIKPLALEMFRSLSFDPDGWSRSAEAKLVFENVQALTRKHIIFCAANQKGIVLGTGDLSELFLGWCTFGADQYSYYNVNGDVPKTLISFLIGWAAEKVFHGDIEASTLLRRIITLDISPELLPPDPRTGRIAQKTEELVGPYALHDFAGYYFVRFGLPSATIARMALHAFASVENPLTKRPYTIADIKHWLRVFLTRFFRAQWKRAAMPEGPKVGMISVDPRGDWRMPSDADPSIWLRELETQVPDQLE